MLVIAAVVAVVFIGAFVESRRKKRRFERAADTGPVDPSVRSRVANGQEYHTPGANQVGPYGP